MTARSSLDSIQSAALRLEPDARVQLAHSLVESLGGLSAAELSELWLAEAERRDAELESGRVTAIPGDEVFARIEDRYGK